MKPLKLDNIPSDLASSDQWILWKYVDRDGKPNKEPFQSDGKYAKSNDRTTWDTLDGVKQFAWQYTGVGFVFSDEDPFVGIDLDGCRNPETGVVAEWAREIVLKFSSYSELSPSETGIKIFCRGKSPLATGRKVEVAVEPCSDKTPAIEIYDHLRYFAVTGWVLSGMRDLKDCQPQIEWLKEKFFKDEPQRQIVDFRSNDSVVERARKYIAKIPDAVSGQSGHNVTFHVACVLVLGFELAESDAMGLLQEYSDRCLPPWSQRELDHKIRSAFQQTGPRGYLRNAAPSNWSKIPVPTYKHSEPKLDEVIEPSTLVGASLQYLESIRNGQSNLVRSSIDDLDYALAGGMEFGEMVIFAARPSHGKSAVALQLVHHWTANGLPCCFVSEEMSSLMLGKRTFQFLSPLHQEHWRDQIHRLESDLESYKRSRAPCFILENTRRADKAAELIERHVERDGVKCVVVDYAQLLQSPGKSRYEQITNTSIALRQLASRAKILLLVLCQLNREVEKRAGEFHPTMSDLRDSGQLEQDADVISFLYWPHKLHPDEPVEKYQFFLEKNRNRMIQTRIVTVNFEPGRQRFSDAMPEEVANMGRFAEIPQ